MTEQLNKNVAVENIVRPTIFLLSNKKKTNKKKQNLFQKNKQLCFACLLTVTILNLVKEP